MSNSDPIVEAVKATPPGGVIVTHLLGINLNDAILYGSALLIVLQLFFLLRKEVYLPWKNRKKTKA